MSAQRQILDPTPINMRGRFAPTPSGTLHWGNLRTALLAWLQVRLSSGVMVMRIEDIDTQRSRVEYYEQILKDVAWLGLDWDEGPDVGGAFGPYFQSERQDLYASALRRLEVYPCDCTRAQLREDRIRTGSERYVGRCRSGRERAIDGACAIRWKVPADEVRFVDRGFGRQSQSVADFVGDFVLRRKNGDFSYQLAVVVDDAQMKITDVCRGADLLDNTPRQLLLGEALGYDAPTYFHVPLVLDKSGNKLSKRDGAPDLHELRAGGCAPGRVIAALARSCGLIASGCPELSARDLLGGIDLEALYAIDESASWAGLE